MTRHHPAVRAVSGLVVAAALGVGLAGCGGDSDGAEQVASLDGAAGGGDSADTTAASLSEADQRQALLDFAECMREHGVDMPDPSFDGQGGVIQVGEMGGDPDVFAEAQAACQPLLEDAMGSFTPNPEQEAQMREQALAFARCMREHGVDFPDPTFGDDGTVVVAVGDSGHDPNDPEVRAAMEACQAEMGSGPLAVPAGAAAGSQP